MATDKTAKLAAINAFFEAHAAHDMTKMPASLAEDVARLSLGSARSLVPLPSAWIGRSDKAESNDVKHLAAWQPMCSWY